MNCEFCNLRLRYPTQAAVATYLPGATFGPRRMRDWEFVWMIEGDAIYRWNSAQVNAPEGSVVLCRPGGTDGFEWDRRRRTRHAFFHFDITTIPASWPPVATWPFARLPREGDIMRSIFRFMLTAGRSQGVPWRTAVMQMLASFVFNEFDSGDVPRDSLPPSVDATLRYVQHRLDKDSAETITLHQLAAAAHVTPEHLCRLFRNATGHTPSETVRLARLDRAAVLLARSNYRIGEIARMCGFSSPFHFSRRFSEAFGHSPREMRKRLDSGATPPVPLLKKWG